MTVWRPVHYQLSDKVRPHGRRIRAPCGTRLLCTSQILDGLDAPEMTWFQELDAAQHHMVRALLGV